MYTVGVPLETLARGATHVPRRSALLEGCDVFAQGRATDRFDLDGTVVPPQVRRCLGIEPLA